MKLKKFNKNFQINNNNKLWLVDYFYRENEIHSFYLFFDEESAKNWAIQIINQERREKDSVDDEDLPEDKIFTEFEPAIDWLEDTFHDALEINFYKISNPIYFELNDKLTKLKNLRKDIKQYNL